PAALSVRPGTIAGAQEGDPDHHPGATPWRPDEGSASTPRGHRKPGRGHRQGRRRRPGGRRAVPEARSAGAMILVLVEHADGRPERLSLEALSLASRFSAGS